MTIAVTIRKHLEEFHVALKACVFLPASSPLHQLVFSGTLLCLWLDMVLHLLVYACAN